MLAHYQSKLVNFIWQIPPGFLLILCTPRQPLWRSTLALKVLRSYTPISYTPTTSNAENICAYYRPRAFLPHQPLMYAA
jgi:hypothetical protein